MKNKHKKSRLDTLDPVAAYTKDSLEKYFNSTAHGYADEILLAKPGNIITLPDRTHLEIILIIPKIRLDMIVHNYKNNTVMYLIIYSLDEYLKENTELDNGWSRLPEDWSRRDYSTFTPEELEQMKSSAIHNAQNARRIGISQAFRKWMEQVEIKHGISKRIAQ